MRSANEQPVDLLWTAGWDSTFRLATLALTHRVAIQPYYVVTASAKSIMELHSMARIRQRISELSASAASLIKPARIISHLDIARDGEVTARFENLRSRAFLGNQYDWLARCARQFELPALELSVHRDDKAYTFLEGHVECVEDSMGGYWRLRPDVVDTGLALFKPFRFPVLELTKLQMREMARKAGFLPVMEVTWFCHEPRGRKACGVCNPCRYAFAEGMGWRIPTSGHMRRYFWPVYKLTGLGVAGVSRAASWAIRRGLGRQPNRPMQA